MMYLKLDAPSSLITNFYTSFERYKFLRLPLGRGWVKTSLRERLTKHENCNGAVGIADDVQVFGNE